MLLISTCRRALVNRRCQSAVFCARHFTRMVLLDNGGRHGSEVTLIAPPQDLSGVIEHLWVQGCGDMAADWRVVADSSPYLIAAVTGTGSRRIRVSLVGARTCAASIDAARRVMTVGVRLRPGALPILTNASAQEFVDRSVPIDDVFTSAVLSGLELGDDAPAALIVHELIRLTRRASGGRTVTSALAGAPARARTVNQISAWLGTPARSLRERMYREVGLSPKRMLRVLRLHAALRAARRSGASWSHVACAAGYADQAHLTREVRALLGETPSAWAARGSAVSFKTHGRDAT
jgi:AraC-like DNA-binding protein